MSDIYELQNSKRKKNADKILYECGLWDFLSKIGQPHIIGSYRMDLMAWNDLDLDIENSCMSREKLYQLTSFVLDVFHPLWYEAKEEVNDEGKRVWFHGFHVLIDDELWNVDLWFFDTETITKAEAYCDGISSAVQGCAERKRTLWILPVFQYGRLPRRSGIWCSGQRGTDRQI